MQVTKFNPRREGRGMNNLLNHFFDDTFTRGLCHTQEAKPPIWNPKVDIYNTKESFIINAELPGVKKSNIKVDVDGRTLSIKGKREEANEENQKTCYRREIFSGTFERLFTLPEAVQIDKIMANYKDGILSLEIPKEEEQKPKEIAIH